MVELAIEYFRAAIVTQDAFPDSDKADQMASDAFWLVFDQLKDLLSLDYNHDRPTDTEISLVRYLYIITYPHILTVR